MLYISPNKLLQFEGVHVKEAHGSRYQLTQVSVSLIPRKDLDVDEEVGLMLKFSKGNLDSKEKLSSILPGAIC